MHPLGRILVEHGLLDQVELEDAILEQELTGRRLGAILVEQGAISAADLAGALAEQFGIELTPAAAPAPIREPGRRGHLRLVRDDETAEVIDFTLYRDCPPVVLAPVHALREGRIAHLEAALGRAVSAAARAQAHVLFVASPSGYALVERDGPPPTNGSELVLDGKPVTVAKLGRSPLPGDCRPCAYVEQT